MEAQSLRKRWGPMGKSPKEGTFSTNSPPIHVPQENVEVPFDLPELSPAATVALVDQSPSQVIQRLGRGRAAACWGGVSIGRLKLS